MRLPPPAECRSHQNHAPGWWERGHFTPPFACFAGGLIITTSVLSLINIFNFDILHYVRAIWNIIFGTIMVFLQLNWQKMISRNFGFLKHWFLRGCFYIFVGTNAMTWESGSDSAQRSPCPYEQRRTIRFSRP